MNSSSIFTRQRMSLDNSVWITMLILILLSIGLFGYSLIKKEETKPCIDIKIYVNGRTNTDTIFFNLGEPLRFRSPVTPGDIVVWDFNDGSRKVEGYTVGHTYNREAKFTVTATVNRKCVYERKVNIIKKSADDMPDSDGNITEKISGPDHAYEGQSMKFLTQLEAKSYSWYIDNNGNFDTQYGKEANFTFRRQGTYKIVLMLDNDSRKKHTKDIVIAKLPEAETKPKQLLPPYLPPLPPKDDPKDQQPETIKTTPKDDPEKKPVKRNISEAVFKEKLQLFVCGELGVKDFDPFLCLGGNTPASLNNKRKTFEAACGEIQGKKIKIESVTLGRDPDNENCVVNIIIKSDKKWGLGKNPCKN